MHEPVPPSSLPPFPFLSLLPGSFRHKYRFAALLGGIGEAFGLRCPCFWGAWTPEVKCFLQHEVLNEKTLLFIGTKPEIFAPRDRMAELEGEYLVDCALETWNERDEDWRAGRVVSKKMPRPSALTTGRVRPVHRNGRFPNTHTMPAEPMLPPTSPAVDWSSPAPAQNPVGCN